jgi:hypothetical protein
MLIKKDIFLKRDIFFQIYDKLINHKSPFVCPCFGLQAGPNCVNY